MEILLVETVLVEIILVLVEIICTYLTSKIIWTHCENSQPMHTLPRKSTPTCWNPLDCYTAARFCLAKSEKKVTHNVQLP